MQFHPPRRILFVDESPQARAALEARQMAQESTVTEKDLSRRLRGSRLREELVLPERGAALPWRYER